MLDSEDSTVTYTTVSSPYKWRSGDVSPGVDGLPVMPEDPYAYVVAAFQALPPPNYVPGPEEPEQAPPSPIYIPYVPELVYPEYIPPEDDDPEDDDEDLKEDPADYPADLDDDEEEEEPSGDDADEEDEEQDEEDDDEEEKHLASADSIPPPPTLRVMARISFRPHPPTLSYGIRDTWIDPRDVAEEEALTTLEGFNTRVTELATVQEQDTQDIYRVMEDNQGRQTEIFQRVEVLVNDSQYDYETGRLVDQEARFSREAWPHSMRLGSIVHFDLQGYMTHTWVQDQRIDAQDTLI
nr:hypothetical protein [Tanacetum cinerariifolium]